MKRQDFYFTAAITCALILLLDGLSYFFMPPKLVGQYSYYRQEMNAPHVARKSPRHLFTAHPERGLDLMPSQKDLSLSVESQRFDRFTNELGCFDKNTLSEIKQSRVYDYFAGDSFTWGYLSYEENFPTLYEQRTQRRSLKCGVSHSGQRHQFSKFKEIVGKVGHYPKKVFVGYFLNDPANDEAYPHTTVIDGYEIDTVGFNEQTKSLEKKDLTHIQAALQAWKTPSMTKDLSVWLRTHSLWFNLLQDLLAPQVLRSFYRLQNFYRHSDNYSKNPMTEKNREILRTWALDAREHHYQLIFILIPDRLRPLTPNPYREFEIYLSHLGIRSLNLATHMLQAPKPSSEYYWARDPHFNATGAAFVTEKLLQTM